MDILKKVCANPAACKISCENIELAGKIYPGDMVVDFPTKKTKSYTLKSIVFYLCNSSVSIPEYVCLCQQEGIQQVSYLDQISIRSDIANYTASDTSGTFAQPVYTHNKEYQIPEFSGLCYIIVPSDISSQINIANAKQLLMRGRDGARNHSAHMIDAGECTFQICDCPTKLRSADWAKVRGIFLDGSKEQLLGWEDRLHSVAKKAAIFSLSGERGEFKAVQFENGKIENIDDIWDAIEKAVYGCISAKMLPAH